MDVAKEVGIFLRWLEASTFMYALGLIVWSLMFADVIPGEFYLSIVACNVSIGFVVAGAGTWFMAIFTVCCEGLVPIIYE